MIPELTANTAHIDVGQDRRKIRVGNWSPNNGSPRAAILLFPGLSEFIDKYEEVARDLLSRNLLVISIDWGGQGLSDRPLPNPHKIHVDSFDRRLEEVDALLKWAGPLVGDLPYVLLGHSMGGHIALRCACQLPPPRLSAVALSAPMVAIGGINGKVGPLAARLAVTLGFSERYLPGRGDYDPAQDDIGASRLSSDKERSTWQARLYSDDPRLIVGGPTWGWLNASSKSVCSVT